LPPREVFGVLAREHITILEGVSPVFAMLADVPGAAKIDLPSLKIVVASRARVAATETSAFQRRFGHGIHQVYGSPVTGAISISREASGEHTPGSIGRPLKGVRVKVVAGGTIGIASPFAATEYLDNPAATSAGFRGGFYLSGDVGAKASDGTITITDRRS